MASMLKDKAGSAVARIAAHTGSTSRSTSPASSIASHSSRKSAASASEGVRDIESARKAKYLLRVSAGPQYDPATHEIVDVNGPEPVLIDNEFIKAQISVRIHNYKGLPLSSPYSSTYFDAESRHGTQYSIAFSFVPKRDISADEATWGIELDDPVRDRLPPGFTMAVRVAKALVDPSIDVDAYADKPWLYAPALTSWFAWRINEHRDVDEWEALPAPEEDHPITEGGNDIDASTREPLSIPTDAESRKKHFRTAENRQAFDVFEAGRLYEADFFNSYIDFSDFALCLPGLKINCLRYIGDKTHKLRWVFKEGREGGKLLFCVVFTLLHGEELDIACQEEEEKLGHKPAEDEGSVPEDESCVQHDDNLRDDFAALPEEQKLGLQDMQLSDANKVLHEHGL